MRLLVTNDDGIHSPFLHVLVRALVAAGHEPFVVAPLHEQSWTGASKSRHRPVVSTVHDAGLGCPTWTIDGTPSDCVNIALAYLLPRRPGTTVADVEGVASGINLGLNTTLGFILASGTVSAAWEGALHGLPAIAFSQDLDQETFIAVRERHHVSPPLAETLAASAAHAAHLVGQLLPTTTPGTFIVHNINFPLPCRADSEVVRTVPARVSVPRLFSPAADDGTHRFVFSDVIDRSPPDLVTDKATVAAGSISHTVLDYTALGA